MPQVQSIVPHRRRAYAGSQAQNSLSLWYWTLRCVFLVFWGCSRGSHACYFQLDDASSENCVICFSCQLNSGKGGTLSSQQDCQVYVQGGLPAVTSDPSAEALYSASVSVYCNGSCNLLVNTS